MTIKYLSALLVIVSLFSCAKKEDDSAPFVSGYKTITVTNGGSIKGIVKFVGAMPTSSIIETQKDQDVCGASHPNRAVPTNTNTIGSCVVYLEKVKEGKAFSTGKFTLDQHGCEFLPHIQALPLGASLVVSNSDGVIHNYHITKGAENIMNEAQPVDGPAHEVKITTAGLLSIGCDVHPWMKGFLFVAENPYYVVSDSTGAFAITDIPEGNYEVVLWRDNWNVDAIKNAEGRITSYKWGVDFSKKQTVNIVKGKETEINFDLP